MRPADLLLPLAGPDVYACCPVAERAQRAIAEVRRLKDDLHAQCGLPRTLEEAGVARVLLDSIARLTINDASAMMNPKELGLEEAREILEKVFA